MFELQPSTSASKGGPSYLMPIGHCMGAREAADGRVLCPEDGESGSGPEATATTQELDTAAVHSPPKSFSSSLRRPSLLFPPLYRLISYLPPFTFHFTFILPPNAANEGVNDNRKSGTFIFVLFTCYHTFCSLLSNLIG